MIKVFLENIIIFVWRRKIYIIIVYNYNIIWYNIVYNLCVLLCCKCLLVGSEYKIIIVIN